MRKTLITTLNSKFIHSCYALHILKACCEASGIDTAVKEYTINQDIRTVIDDIFKYKPEIICFSCYIWNIGLTLKAVRILKKILKDCVVILGGPEVSYDSTNYLDYADFVVSGEGEKALPELLSAVNAEAHSFADIKGLAFKENGIKKFNGKREYIDMNAAPFAYKSTEGFENRIMYYETQRGCPFKCAYCLSGGEKLRFLHMDRIKRELKFFTDRKIRQLKFVDRTFNADRNHAYEIWRYLAETDNGYTNFHFEIAGDLLDEKSLELLKNVRPELFQFEIGVQSANIRTLGEISRKTDLSGIKANVLSLMEYDNINIHLDLIAGLPGEDIRSFAESFDYVWSMHPEQLQLGFLKLLKGSALRLSAEKYGIAFDEDAPYEFLFTDALSYNEVLALKQAEEMLESCYNSGKLMFSLKYVEKRHKSMFRFFMDFAEYFFSKHTKLDAHKKNTIYEAFYEYCETLQCINQTILRELIAYDLLLNENIAELPSCLGDAGKCVDMKTFRDFSNNAPMRAKYLPDTVSERGSTLPRTVRLSVFSFDVTNESRYDDPEMRTSYILFDYTSPMKKKSLRTFHARNADITNELAAAGKNLTE